MRDDELYHHGVKGMKWGIRRYQNYDGSLTSAGKKKYGDRYFDDGRMKILDTDSKVTKRVKKDYNELSESQFAKKYAASRDTYSKRVMRYGDPYMKSPLAKLGKKLAESERRKKEIQVVKEGKAVAKRGNQRKRDAENAMNELKEIKKNKHVREKPYKNKDLETIRTQKSFNKKSVNASSKYLAKQALKRAGIATAVGIGGGYALSRAGYRSLGRALATAAGAYTGSTLISGLGSAAAAKVMGEGYLAAKRSLSKRRRRKTAARRKQQKG